MTAPTEDALRALARQTVADAMQSAMEPVYVDRGEEWKVAGEPPKPDWDVRLRAAEFVLQHLRPPKPAAKPGTKVPKKA